MTSIYIKEGTTLPQRRELDFYPTPNDKVYDGLNVVVNELFRSEVGINEEMRILDPGAGDGVWGNCCRQLWPGSWIVGVELREVVPADGYDQWVIGEFEADVVAQPFGLGEFDLVLGNPPYRDAEHFVRTSLAYLRPGGHLLFLLRLAFLESKGRGLGLFRELPPKRVEVCMSRPSFTGNGKTNATSFAFFLWEKGWQGETVLSWR